MKKLLSLLMALMLVFSLAATAAAAQGAMEDPYAPIVEMDEIEEDETPLDELTLYDPETPKTGDNAGFWVYAALLSGVSLVAVAVMRPKKENGER